MASPERMALMERNIRQLALLVKQLGETELANQQRRFRNELRMQEWEQRMQEWEQRIQESNRRIREHDEEIRRLLEGDAVRAENIRAMLAVIVEMQADIARLDAAS